MPAGSHFYLCSLFVLHLRRSSPVKKRPVSSTGVKRKADNADGGGAKRARTSSGVVRKPPASGSAAKQVGTPPGDLRLCASRLTKSCSAGSCVPHASSGLLHRPIELCHNCSATSRHYETASPIAHSFFHQSVQACAVAATSAWAALASCHACMHCCNRRAASQRLSRQWQSHDPAANPTPRQQSRPARQRESPAAPRRCP